jgi:predicted amidophosphoribosyltransferase
MKCTECGLYASPSAKFCEECGGDVKIDESIIKECPECSKKLKSTAKFCTGCRFSFENVTKKIICEGKREDDTKCNRELSPSDRICSRCGTRLRKEDGMNYIYFSH